jgi:NADH-quinone oxidoreductase subunit C
MAMEEKKILKVLKESFQEKIKETSAHFGDETLVIDRDSLLEIVTFLKNKPYEYNMLLDLTCVDFFGQEPRFEMVYHLFSLPMNHRLRIKMRLSEKDLSIDSLTSLWENANWLEREVYDLFGVHFNGHPYLKRIFMYEGFEGHPLRKDYPLRKRQPRIPLRK